VSDEEPSGVPLETSHTDAEDGVSELLLHVDEVDLDDTGMPSAPAPAVEPLKPEVNTIDPDVAFLATLVSDDQVVRRRAVTTLLRSISARRPHK
jgi:hypothetical protein